MPAFLNHIDKSWTLFLDRDGVINKRPPDDYVKSWSEFKFLPGVLDALRISSSIFQKIIVITNQQGVGKKMMSIEDLNQIHDNLLLEVAKNGGKIDAIYFCPDLSTKPKNCRKPTPAMAQQALNDFPDIDITKSIMAGDMLTDMQFGKRIGMKTVYLNTNNAKIPASEYDTSFNSLIELVHAINAID